MPMWEGRTDMLQRARATFALAVAASFVASLMFAATALATGAPISTTMTGTQEVPGPGDPDGSGTAVLRLNPGKGQICYTLTVSGIGDPIAAHIHQAPPGVAGPVVVPLAAPVDGSSNACATVAKDLIKAILLHPEDYYVNVHNIDFRAGAIRGQLSR